MRPRSRAWSRRNFANLIGLEDAEFTRSYSQFKILTATAWAVGGCGLVLGGLGIANTMIMSVFTRIREIAILRVNGFSHLQIATMIFGESAVVSLLGAALGLLTGTCLLLVLKQVPAVHGYIDVTVRARRHADRDTAGPAHWNCRRALPGSLCHARPRGGGAALRMNPVAAKSKSTGRVVLRAEDVWKSYDDGAIAVLKGVDFAAVEGQTVALCGPSGCGKSTLLHLFGGLDAPDRGRVYVNAIEIDRHRNLLRLLRSEIGFVFQLHNLIPDLTLEENCLIPTVAAGTDRQTAQARLRQLADRTGLTPRLGQRIQKLSGGERQRTALCRALMNKPKILLADEPTGSLDEVTSATVFELLLDLVATEGVTLVMATHDRSLADRCDRLLEMHDGRIHEPAYLA